MAAITMTQQRSGQVALGLLKFGLAGCTLALIGTIGLVLGKVMGLVT